MVHHREINTVKVLFAASEVTPLVKTGGLADVAGSLPIAVSNLGADVRIVIPGYRGIVDRLDGVARIGEWAMPGVAQPGGLATARLTPSGPVFVVIEAPGLFARDGGIYTDASGQDYGDNAHRFAVFSRAVTALALGHGPDGWCPDIVHCNDWQTGLVPALLSREWNRPATLFTIHNLAYQGVYGAGVFADLDLPGDLWSMSGLEYHGNLSFIKGGIAFADVVTTVSPTYASEICTPELGYGLEGLLAYRQERLFGVLNGIDIETWNPATDPHLPQAYDVDNLSGKAIDKSHLQQQFGLAQMENSLLFAHIGRLVEQKGADMIVAILPRLLEQPHVQLVILGSGDPLLEAAVTEAAREHPQQVGVKIGYDEPLAHLIEAGADSFIMPSRFEPCGLNQMYSLRYGTIPIIRRTGGLADTVVDASSDAVLDGIATGFVFEHADADSLWSAVQRAMRFRDKPPARWHEVQRTGMRRDFSWRNSAEKYYDLYGFALDHRLGRPAKLSGL